MEAEGEEEEEGEEVEEEDASLVMECQILEEETEEG